MRKNRRSFAIFAAAALAAACLCGALAGCAPASSGAGDGQPEGDTGRPEQTLPEGYRPESPSAFAEPPQDGSTPADYTALENFAFVAGRLAQRRSYHADSFSTAEAGVLFIKVEQTVRGTKDFDGGVLVTSTVSTSSSALAPSKAMQKYFGEREVIVRGPASDSVKDWENGVAWAEGEPSEILDEPSYSARYGLWASELTDFIVNADTVLSASSLQAAEGGFALTFDLCVEGENDAARSYKKQMVTMGDLDEEPSFTSLRLTLRFAPDWTVLSLSTEEAYTSKKMVSAKVTGRSSVTFSYDAADVDVSAYDEYFRAYA